MIRTQLQVRRLGYAAGAEITGLDLCAPLDDETFETIRQAWHDHLVLCFRDQRIDKQQFLAFAQRFGGELDDFTRSKNRDANDPRVVHISSKPEPGKNWDGYKLGMHWHSDRSYNECPATGTFVLAKEIPEVGGDTMFANQYMAYETLSPAMQRIFEGLSTIHDQDNIDHSRQKAQDNVVSVYRGKYDASVHPVVKAHQETGRKAIYVGSRVRQFVGMTEDESRPLLEFLRAHCVRYEFIYRHRWSINDLIVWDNRCLLHYAPLDYDPQTQPRFMWRCSLVGPRSGTALKDPSEDSAAHSQ